MSTTPIYIPYKKEHSRKQLRVRVTYIHTYITTITITATTTITITAYTAAFPQSRSSSAGIQVISAPDIGQAGGRGTANLIPEHPLHA